MPISDDENSDDEKLQSGLHKTTKRTKNNETTVKRSNSSLSGAISGDRSQKEVKRPKKKTVTRSLSDTSTILPLRPGLSTLSSSKPADTSNKNRLTSAVKKDPIKPTLLRKKSHAYASTTSKKIGSDDDLSSSTESSNAPVESSKLKMITANISVTFDHKIKFEISKQRPDTLMDGQGDHITSYVAVLESVLSTVNDIGIRAACDALVDLNKRFLGESNCTRKSGFPALPDVRTHADRKNIMKEVNSTSLSAKDIQLVDDSMKFHKQAQLAGYMESLANYFLKKIQKQTLTSAYSRGRTNSINAEGPTSNSAANALKSLDSLIKLETMNDDTLSANLVKLKESLRPHRKGAQTNRSSHFMRYGLNAWENRLEKSDAAEQFNSLRSDLDNAKAPDEIKKHAFKIKKLIETQTDRIADCFGDLYDYSRELTFDLNRATPLNETEQKNVSTHPEKEREIRVAKLLAQFNSDTPTASPSSSTTSANTVTITRTNLDTLINTLKNHKKILAAAYPNLSKTPEFDSAFNKFIENTVLKKQGWKNHMVTGVTLKPLDLETIKGKMRADVSAQPKSGPTL